MFEEPSLVVICGCSHILLCFPDCSVGKESACNSGDPGLIPRSGRSTGEGIGYPLQYFWASLVSLLVKKSACNEADLSSIPGLGRSPGEGKEYPSQSHKCRQLRWSTSTAERSYPTSEVRGGSQEQPNSD